jgi:hypothetical protein
MTFIAHGGRLMRRVRFERHVYDGDPIGPAADTPEGFYWLLRAERLNLATKCPVCHRADCPAWLIWWAMGARPSWRRRLELEAIAA